MKDESTFFRKKFREIYDKSGHPSMRQLAKSADVSESTLQQIQKGQFDGSRTGPGIFAMRRLSNEMGFSLDSLFNTSDKQPQQDLGSFNGTSASSENLVSKFIETHWRGGARLEAFNEIIEYCDLYHSPDPEATSPHLYSAGKFSLMSKRIGSNDHKLAQNELNELPVDRRREIINFHRKVTLEQTAISSTFLDHRLKTPAVHVRASYSRLGLFVADAKGSAFVLIYCAPIPV